MNDFIRITNKVMEEKLKGKIHISSVAYYIRDGIFIIDVKYSTDTYDRMGFSYSYYQINPDLFIMELDFRKFINAHFDGCFNL